MNSSRLKFSWSAFSQGLAVTALIYASLAGWLMFRSAQSHQVAVPVFTATIERPATAAAIIKPGTTAPAFLPPAPFAGLTEQTTAGLLPVIRSDGLTPFKAYRRPFARATKTPIVSIVIADLGLKSDMLDLALTSLPPDVSFDISPYADAPTNTINAVRAKGHEAWLTLPLESSFYPQVDTGADTLLIGASVPENRDKLLRTLASGAGYAGVLTSADPAFLKSAGDMQPVVAMIYDRGLGLVDTSKVPEPEVQTMALPKNAAYASADLYLDTSATPADIRAALAQLEQEARKKGMAVAIIHPLPVSIHEVAAWLATLPAKGIVLAPLSAQTGQQ